MKLLLLAALVGVVAADRLDNSYLPPIGARGLGGVDDTGPGGAAGRPGPFGGPPLSVGRGGIGSGLGAGRGAGLGVGMGGAGIGARQGGFGGAGGGGGADGAGAGRPGPFGGPPLSVGRGGIGSGLGAGRGAGLGVGMGGAGYGARRGGLGGAGGAFSYETANGIAQDEQGYLKNAGIPDAEAETVQGQYTYTGDDSAQYTVTYTADEYGFQPQGAHLPTPPPIPPEILASLEQNAAAARPGGVFDGPSGTGTGVFGLLA